MRTITIQWLGDEIACSSELLGRVGENKATTVHIDVRRVLSVHSGATFTLLCETPDTLVTPLLASETASNGLLTWEVLAMDLAQSGALRFQLEAAGTGGTLLRSPLWTMRVEDGLAYEEEAL